MKHWKNIRLVLFLTLVVAFTSCTIERGGYYERSSRNHHRYYGERRYHDNHSYSNRHYGNRRYGW